MVAIVAIAEDGGIGYKGGMPWPKISEDFKFFKEKTLNQRVVFGMSTREKLPPLPNRIIFTLSSKHKDLDYENGDLGAFYFKDEKGDLYAEHYATSIENAGNDCWLCGGASIYRQFLHLCDEVYITHVKGIYEADTFFPFSMDEINTMFPNNEIIKELTGGHTVVRYYKL